MNIPLRSSITSATLATLAILLGSQFVSSKAHAAYTNAKCEHVLTGSGNIQINRQWDVERRVCFLSITPRNIIDLKYRDYYFSNSGELMVFNSYGDGDPSKTTSSRDYFLFPLITDYPDYSIEDNDDVTIKMVSGHELRLSAVDFSIVSLTPGTFTELPLSPKNKGGVEIMPARGFWVDGGFKMGGTGFDHANNKSIIHSANSSKSCSLTNKEFLGYANGNYGFKYQGADLQKFFTQKCPDLKF
ncbi:MAG: hypothetical protein H7328_08385 [Bdellovibrio sp.]|nr:hypothetical protein [Bdellovibrio sp.]